MMKSSMSCLTLDQVEIAQPLTIECSSTIIFEVKNNKINKLSREIIQKTQRFAIMCKLALAFQKVNSISLLNFQQKQLIIQIEVMGCFPDKPINKGQPLSPEKERLIKQFYQENPNNSQVYLPINIKSSLIKKQETPKSRKSLTSTPKKFAATPMRGQRSAKKRFPLSLEKQIDTKTHEGKLMRKQIDGRTILRKKGKVVELPFRQHLITRIETPSETAQTSLLSNLQKHPSEFFTKFESKLIRNKQADKKKDQNLILDGIKGNDSMRKQSKTDEPLLRQR